MESLRTTAIRQCTSWIYQRTSVFVWIIFSWIMCCECFKEKNLTIGGIFPMVGGWGGGVGCLPAVEMALEDINNSTDVLPNYQLWMVGKDSQVKRRNFISNFNFELWSIVELYVLYFVHGMYFGFYLYSSPIMHRNISQPLPNIWFHYFRLIACGQMTGGNTGLNCFNM